MGGDKKDNEMTGNMNQQPKAKISTRKRTVCNINQEPVRGDEKGRHEKGKDEKRFNIPAKSIA